MGEDKPSHLSRIVSGSLRSLSASFPGFATLGQAWSEYENYRTEERICELISNFANKMKLLAERIDNLEEITKEIGDEFPSLLEMTIEKVKIEFSAEKRRIYADVLAVLLLKEYKKSYNEKSSIIHALEFLDTTDLEVLKLFKNREETAVRELGWENLGLIGDENQRFAQLVSKLAKLESRGLIVTISLYNGVIHMPRGIEQWIARWRETKFRILPLGKDVLSTLE